MKYSPRRSLLFVCFLLCTAYGLAQTVKVTGSVHDKNGNALSGASVATKSGHYGTTTDSLGRFQLSVDSQDVLVVSFTGYTAVTVAVPKSGSMDIVMEGDGQALNEVVVVGYGSQKKSDITGAVASLPRDRLDMMPNVNLAQAIQGAVPGVVVQSSSAGAAPSQSILVRGRNSIKASTEPLIVLDGVPYGGALDEINPNDIESVEVLKDASSAAIYGSRGANGVILVTSKTGAANRTIISYDGKYSMQRYAHLPDLMTGAEFYQFKMQREPTYITQTERDVYNSGDIPDWVALATRPGRSQQHNLSASGGNKAVRFYIAGGFLNTQGIQRNDNFKRISLRVNLDAHVTDWLTFGTRTQLSFSDESGASPSTEVFRMNPLSRPYDKDGKLTIYPWVEDIYFPNPLQATLYDNKDVSYQVVTNNYALVEFPFLPGLSYRINSGIRITTGDYGNYAGRNTATGFEGQGVGETRRSQFTNTVLENILSYKKEFGSHSFFATAVYSYEQNKGGSNNLVARGFPHDFLSYYSAPQAKTLTPSYSFTHTVLLSQMLRLNYSYDSRYLVTLTARRDGFSGFGSEKKWGIFPSAALGWNISNEKFFRSSVLNELKLRVSYGLNGNQAVGPYQTISRLGSYDIVANGATLPGYIPSVLGQDNLGWESSATFNIGLDFSLLKNRISGDINVFRKLTSDLLLDRSISPISGITSITQNIGKTQNTGIELGITSRNFNGSIFRWMTTANASFIKNKIVSLYGVNDASGKEIDDVLNKWFIGRPIRVNYGYRMAGVWQTSEAAEAALYGAKPGYVKIDDANGDKLLNAADRQIVGQLDPSFTWGLTNTFSYGNFSLSVFLYGVHGVTRANALMKDDVYPAVRRNTINKNRWTPSNPTNEFYANDKDASKMAGIDFESEDQYYENASFMRIRDVSVSYDFPRTFISKAGLGKLRLYVTGRNLATFTKWKGLDPELDEQRGIPLQREFVIGLNLTF